MKSFKIRRKCKHYDLIRWDHQIWQARILWLIWQSVGSFQRYTWWHTLEVTSETCILHWLWRDKCKSFPVEFVSFEIESLCVQSRRFLIGYVIDKLFSQLQDRTNSYNVLHLAGPSQVFHQHFFKYCDHNRITSDHDIFSQLTYLEIKCMRVDLDEEDRFCR